MAHPPRIPPIFPLVRLTLALSRTSLLGFVQVIGAVALSGMTVAGINGLGTSEPSGFLGRGLIFRPNETFESHRKGTL